MKSDRSGKANDFWKVPSTSSTSIYPAARWCHSCTYIEKQGKIVIFGGMNTAKVHHDMFFFDIYAQKWTKWDLKMQQAHLKKEFRNQNISCIWPKERIGHTFTIVNENSIVLIGGYHELLNEIYWFDLEKYCWRRSNTSTTETIVIKDDLLVNKCLLKDHEILPSNSSEPPVDEDVPFIGTESVEVIHTGFGTSSMKGKLDGKIEVQIKSIFPVPRSQHTTVTYRNDGNDELYMFGGGGTQNYKLNDLWVLNGWEWTKVQTNGEAPKPRWGHSATIIQNTMYIFGGTTNEGMSQDLFSFDIPSRTWREISLLGPRPSNRAAHSMCSFGEKLFILWGGDNSKFLNDLCIVDTVTRKTGVISFLTPGPRCNHTAISIGSKMVVFGGCDMRDDEKTRVFKELYVVDLFVACFKGNMEIKRQSFPEKESGFPQLIGVECDATDMNLKRNEKKPSHRIRSSSNAEEDYYMKNQGKKIGNWLTSLGLARYIPKFIQEEIELAIVGDLTEEDLIRMGIDKIGPRKKILQASLHESRKYRQEIPPETHIYQILHQSSTQLAIACETLNHTIRCLSQQRLDLPTVEPKNNFHRKKRQQQKHGSPIPTKKSSPVSPSPKESWFELTEKELRGSSR